MIKCNLSGKSIGIIGTGNLGKSLTTMLLRQKRTDPISLFCSVRNKERYNDLEKYLNISNGFSKNKWCIISNDNNKIAESADYIIMSVKPAQIKSICDEISEKISPETPVISVAAAVPLEKLHQWLPKSKTIIRCMPNIPCSIGKGIVPYISNSDPKYTEELMSDFFNPNIVLPLSTNDQIDIATLISGCGPAFLSWYIKCIKQVANSTIDEIDLNNMITQTMIGTADMLRDKSCNDIIKEVASPRGATEAIINTLNNNKVDDMIYNSLETALVRIKTISKDM